MQLMTRLQFYLFFYLQLINKTMSSDIDYSFRNHRYLQQPLKQLKSQIDCLLIRMNSCEQFIQKLFAIAGGNLSPTKTNGSFNRSFNHSQSNSFDKKTSEIIPKQIQLSEEFRNSDYESPNKNNIKTSSTKDFLIFPASREIQIKQLDTNSFSLIKNSIMINSDQIQNLSQQLSKIQTNISKRFDKNEEVIQLLTKVVYRLQDQFQNKFGSVIAAVHAKQARKRDKSSVKKYLRTYYPQQ